MDEKTPLIIVTQMIQDELNKIVIKYVNSGVPAFLIDKILESTLADVRKLTIGEIINQYDSSSETSAKEEEKVDAESIQ